MCIRDSLIGVQMLFHGFRNDEVFKYIAELGVRNQCFDLSLIHI